MPWRDVPSRLGELARRARYLVFRGRASAELEEEMRLHVALREARLVERGASPMDAHYAARRRFGNWTNLQQRSRDAWGLAWLDEALADVRFALRRLRARPGFALTTILVAALGVGATTAVFSAIDAALIRPLPFSHGDELVTLTDVGVSMEPAPGEPRNGPHYPDVTDVARMHDLFSGVGAFAAGGLNMDDPSHPRRVNAGVVTAHFFSLLGVSPERGREFTDDEGRPHGPRAVILSDAFWRGALGGAGIVGKSIRLNGQSYTVVGVMPPAFNFPDESEVWIPLPVPFTLETFAPFRGYLPSHAFARLAPGVSLDAANVQLLTRWRRISRATGWPGVTNFDQAMAELSAKHAVRPLKQALVGDRRRAFVILMGAATFLLLIACANVANLLLSDAAARRREIALRAALGASQGRMVRQLLTESLLLAFAGAAVGLALAPIALRVLRALMPENLAGVAAAEIDVRVLAFAAALAVLTGLSFGLWPAFGAARTDAGEMVKSGSRGGTSGVGTARRVLITTELALTVMLLIGSGLMLRSLDRVLAQRMGMIPEHVGTLELSMPGAAHAVQTTTVHAILTRLEGEPGITAVGVVNQLPLRGEGGFSIAITVDGVPPPSSIDATPFARFLSASGGYFHAMGIPLLRGRTFTAADDSTAPLVAVISETMARVCWPNADPIGKTFHFADRGPATVVGVVADVREQAIDGEIQPQLYLPFDVEPDLNLAIVARSALAPTTLLARLRDAVRSADPSQPVYNIRMMDDVISTAVAPRRTNTTLIVLFGAVALALAAFGVYAVVSYGVTRRARELGIRAALGATGSDIAALIAREMLWVTGLGLTIGLAGAWALSRVLSALLYGVDRHDAITFAIVPLVLLLPAAIATLVPARRAMRVDPAVVMRQE